MAKGLGGDLSVDALRRAERKKAKAKNKRERTKAREEALATRDPEELRAQVARLAPLEAAGKLDGAGRKQLEQLKKQLRVCLDKRREGEAAQQARRAAVGAVTFEGFGEGFGAGGEEEEEEEGAAGGGAGEDED